MVRAEVIKGGAFWKPQIHAKPGPEGSVGGLSWERETQETWKDVIQVFLGWQIYFINIILKFGTF